MASAIVLTVLFALLSPERRSGKDNQIDFTKNWFAEIPRHRGKLAGLFALDAFAGGFIVQSIVAYWFYLRLQTD